jgi:uncharacterized protein (UPF0303 family)
VSIAEDLARIATQERELAFAQFDESTAWLLGSHLRELAVSRRFPVLVIDVRRFGQPLFYSTVGQTVPDHAEWIRRKSNVVARFHRSSYALGLEMQQKNSTLTERYGLPLADYASHGGGFPLRVAAAGVIGSVTVSGLPQREDHELAVEALCALLGREYADFKLPDAPR